MADFSLGSALLGTGIDLSGLKKGLDQAHSDTQSTFGKIGNVLGGALAVGATAAVAGLVGVGAALVDCTKGAMEAEEIQAALNAVLESTGGKAGMTADAVNDLASSLQDVTKFEDDAIVEGENLLLTFTSIGKDVFPQATETMLDMSQALGQDMKASAIQLGKALNDPIAGVSALRKVGVSLTEAQEAQIKTFMASGDIMSAQKVILKELATEFGGAARAAGQTMAGQMAILQNKIGSVKDTIGAALLPTLTRLATVLNDALARPEVQEAITAIAKGIGDIAEKVVGLLGSLARGDMGGIMGALGISPDIVPAARGMLSEVQSAWQTFISGVTPIMDTIRETVMSVLASPELQDAAKQVRRIFVEIILPSAQKLAAWFKTNWPAMSKTIQAVIVAMGQFVTKILLPAYTSYYKFIADNWPKVEKVITTVFKTIQTVVTAIVKAVMPFITEEAGKVVEWTQKNWPLIQKTIETVMKAIQTVVETVLKLITAFWENYGEQIMVIVENNWRTIRIIIDTTMVVIMGIIRTVMQIITGDWEGAWETICDTTEAVWDAIKALVANALDTLNRAIIQPAMNAISSFIRSAWESIQSTIQTILNAINGITQNAWNTMQSIISSVLSAIVSLISSQFNGIQSAIQVAWNAVSSITQAAWNTIQNIVNSVLSAITSYITAQFNLIQTIISNVWSAVSSATSGWWATIQNTINDFLYSIASFISSQFDDIRNTIDNAWAAVNDFTASWWDAITGTLSGALAGVIDTVYGNFQSVINAVSDAWAAIRDGVSGWWDAITGTIGSAIAGIPDAVAWAIGELVSIGYNIVQSIKDGILGLWYDATEGIGALLGDLISWLGFGDFGWSIIEGIKDAVLSAWDSFVDWLWGLFGGIEMPWSSTAMASAARGLDMIVPPGFPNDSFLIRATSGEHVNITPHGQPSITIYGGLSLYGVQDAPGLLEQLAALQSS